MTRFDDLGPNSGLVEELYQRYLRNPASVDDHWRAYFSDATPPTGDGGAPAPPAPPPAGSVGRGGARRRHRLRPRRPRHRRARARWCSTVTSPSRCRRGRPHGREHGGLGFGEIPWLSDPYWARFSVILVNVGRRTVLPDHVSRRAQTGAGELYEAAAIDGANTWQKFIHITLPMMRNIIAITVLFSLIVTFANFDIVQIMTAGGPRNMTHVFATYAFLLGIRSGDLPLGAATSLFMFPILAIAAVFILRGRAQAREEIG